MNPEISFTNGEKQSPFSKVIRPILAAFAEMERGLLKERITMGIKASDKKPGRPVGYYYSKLDPKRDEIQELLDAQISISGIARIIGVSRNTVNSFIKVRGLKRKR